MRTFDVAVVVSVKARDRRDAINSVHAVLQAGCSTLPEGVNVYGWVSDPDVEQLDSEEGRANK